MKYRKIEWRIFFIVFQLEGKGGENDSMEIRQSVICIKQIDCLGLKAHKKYKTIWAQGK